MIKNILLWVWVAIHEGSHLTGYLLVGSRPPSWGIGLAPILPREDRPWFSCIAPWQKKFLPAGFVAIPKGLTPARGTIATAAGPIGTIVTILVISKTAWCLNPILALAVAGGLLWASLPNFMIDSWCIQEYWELAHQGRDPTTNAL